MKKIFCVFICFLGLLLSGCDKNEAFLTTNTQPITKKTVFHPIQQFKPGQHINYALLKSKGFEDSVLRLQIIKKDDKIPTWGYKIHRSFDICVNEGDKFYIGYFTIHEKGYYILRAFEIRNLDKPIAMLDIRVK